jgi:hypothetical protein
MRAPIDLNELLDDPRLQLLHEEARAAVHPRVVKLEIIGELEEWGKTTFDDPAEIVVHINDSDDAMAKFTLAHELAHVLHYGTGASLRVRPGHTAQASELKLFAAMIDLREHRRVHDLLRARGFDIMPALRSRINDIINQSDAIESLQEVANVVKFEDAEEEVRRQELPFWGFSLRLLQAMPSPTKSQRIY